MTSGWKFNLYWDNIYVREERMWFYKTGRSIRVPGLCCWLTRWHLPNGGLGSHTSFMSYFQMPQFTLRQHFPRKIIVHLKYDHQTGISLWNSSNPDSWVTQLRQITMFRSCKLSYLRIPPLWLLIFIHCISKHLSEFLTSTLNRGQIRGILVV